MPSRQELALLRQLRRAVDRLEPRLAEQLQRAFRQLQARVPVARLERAIASRDAFAIHDITAALPQALRPSLRTLQHAFAHGARAGRAMLPEQLRVSWRFDATNPHMARAATEGQAAAIQGITQETRAAIHTVVGRAFTEGLPPREAAQLIRPMVGLTERQARAVAGRRRDLVEQGWSRTEALAGARDYAYRLLAQRALLIARTEIIRSSTQGQLAAWHEAVLGGYLRPQSLKAWMTTADDRLCRFCRSMNEKKVPMGSKFATPFGLIPGPPLHPNCRCAVFLVPVAVPLRRAA